MAMTISFREVGTYRGGAAICGCDPKTIKRALTRATPDVAPAVRKEPVRNYDGVRDLVAARVERTAGRISAKRLLPEAPWPGRVARFPPICPAGGGPSVRRRSGRRPR